MEVIREITRNRYFWLWLALVLLSLGLHLYELDLRPFHSDEAIHAKLSYDLAYTGEYRYNPTYHGPLLYYLTTLIYWIFGDSDFTARLPAALSGISMLYVSWKLSAIYGKKAAWWTGFLLTISPLYLYYGRFLRMDILEVLVASLAFLSLYEALHLKKERAWIMLGFWSALAFATKENAYITTLLAILTTLAILFNLGWHRGLRSFYNWLLSSWKGPVAAISIWVIVSITLYTIFFKYPQDWVFPAKAVGHWAEQHNIERVGGPWWYHLFRLAQYEFLVVISATIWIFRQPSLRIIDFSLYFFGCASIAMYAYLGEKVPWLGIHQIWSFLPLAGAQIARTFGSEGKYWSRGIAISGISATLIISVTANYFLDRISPQSLRTESLQYAETTVELKQLVVEIIEKGTMPSGVAAAAVEGVSSWPLVWYLRHEKINWSLPVEDTAPDFILLDSEKLNQIEHFTGSKYVMESIPVRSWWLPEQKAATLSEFIRYLITRKPWTSVTFSNSLVLRKKPENNL